MHQRDGRNGGPKHLEDRTELLTADEALAVCVNAACIKMTPQATTMIRASQNGKKPLLGPSGPHPKPSRTASKRTRPPRSINTDAVTSSAARIYFLSSPPLAIRSRWSCSFSSTHLTYSAPDAKAGLSAPSSRYF